MLKNASMNINIRVLKMLHQKNQKYFHSARLSQTSQVIHSKLWSEQSLPLCREFDHLSTKHS